MWQGAIPSFNIRAITINVDIGSRLLDHIVIVLISNTLDPMAWAIKYFTVASISWFFDDASRIGKKANKFTSRATHKNIQLLLDIAIIVETTITIAELM